MPLTRVRMPDIEAFHLMKVKRHGTGVLLPKIAFHACYFCGRGFEGSGLL